MKFSSSVVLALGFYSWVFSPLNLRLFNMWHKWLWLIQQCADISTFTKTQLFKNEFGHNWKQISNARNLDLLLIICSNPCRWRLNRRRGL